MINKSKRTIDKYMQAGAKLRLLKTLLSDTYDSHDTDSSD